MKHPGIYLHTDPADPESPLWMLHWSSLTLAKLSLLPDPVLIAHSATPPPDAVFEALARLIEDMAPGMSEGLTMVTARETTPDTHRGPLFMAPADSSAHGFAAIDPSTGLAIGAIDTAVIGPIWKVPPADLHRRDTAIHTLATFAYQEIQRVAAGDSLLELLRESSYFPGLWIQRPDLAARSAAPVLH